MYAVIGGAGRTGGRVVGRLLAAGHEVRVVSRHAGGEPRRGVEYEAADLASLRAREPALVGIDGVVVSVEPPYDAAGAEAVLDSGVRRLARLCAEREVPVVLVSQIYVTRPHAYPEMAEVTRARGRGEQALRESGAPYTIVRPGWLHDGAAGGARVEQGDTGDGRVSRDLLADAAAHALLDPGARSRTFELFDGDQAGPPDWASVFSRLRPDATGPDG